MSCTATLRTWSDDCELDHWADPDCDCVYVEEGFETRFITLHTLTCALDADGHTFHTTDPTDGDVWNDGTPGATYHTPPLVTDAEVEAARRAVQGRLDDPDFLRRALEAAAEVRQGPTAEDLRSQSRDALHARRGGSA